MKGPRELKLYVARNRKWIKACHYDDLMLFKGERCKNWFKRVKKPTANEWNE